MLKLVKGREYTNNNAAIIVQLVDILSCDEKGCQVILNIYTKTTGRLIEDRQAYDLTYNKIRGWEEFDGKIWKEFPYKTSKS